MGVPQAQLRRQFKVRLFCSAAFLGECVQKSRRCQLQRRIHPFHYSRPGGLGGSPPFFILVSRLARRG